MSKTKSSILNLVTDVVPLIIISFLGIFKLKFFIEYLGQETLGLYQLFSQIMFYIAIVDGGITTALLNSMYKPNVDKDHKSISKLYSSSIIVFFGIGITILLLAILVSFFVPKFIHETSFNDTFIIITFILFSLTSVISYFLVPKKTIFEVKEKKYIYNLIEQSSLIIQSVIEIILLLNGYALIYILLMHIIIKLFLLIITSISYRILFKNVIYTTERDYSFVKKTKSLMSHKVNGLITSNVDTILLSIFSGLRSIAVYSTYFYIINMLKIIIGKFSTSILAIIGNKMKDKNSDTYKLYLEFNNLMFYIAIVITVPLIFAISNFINIWYENDIYTSFSLGFSFSLLLFVFIIKLPTTTYINAAGLFKETSLIALLDALINLILSLFMLYLFGIPGVVMATAISAFISEYILKNKVLFTHHFSGQKYSHFKNNIIFFLIFFIDLIIAILIFNNVNIYNIFEWFIIFGSFFIVNAIVIYLLFNLFKKNNFTLRYYKLIKRRM